jgi:hypothetical protein
MSFYGLVVLLHDSRLEVLGPLCTDTVCDQRRLFEIREICRIVLGISLGSFRIIRRGYAVAGTKDAD